jgi:serine/threonine protein kinase
VAYFEKRKSGFVCASFFLSEKIENAEEIRALFRRCAGSDLDSLLFSLAQHLSLCHAAGILHRDLSDGNILVKKDGQNSFAFYLLDTNRIRLRRKISGLTRVKNLIRLGIPPSAQKQFLEYYFGEKPPGQFLWVWYKINKTVYTRYVKLKRVLRLRQLARKLGVQ